MELHRLRSLDRHHRELEYRQQVETHQQGNELRHRGLGYQQQLERLCKGLDHLHQELEQHRQQSRYVSPGVAPPTSTGVAPDIYPHVTPSATCGPTAGGIFTHVAYDELTSPYLLNLTERAPRASPLDREKSLEKRGSFTNTDRRPTRVSEGENVAVKHQDPLR